MMRERPVDISPAELEAIEVGEPRKGGPTPLSSVPTGVSTVMRGHELFRLPRQIDQKMSIELAYDRRRRR